MSTLIALAVVVFFVCLLFAAWIAFSERGDRLDGWFRKRWGGSDARRIDP